jgi:DNA (cytosine-5)-methyltransferase 1
MLPIYTISISPDDNRKSMNNKAIALDLFAGVGGATKGLQQAGFTTFSIERDKEAADIHRRNLGECLQADVLYLEPLAIKEELGNQPTLMWLSPPCQAHSKAGMGKTKGRKDADILSVLIRKGWFTEMRSPYVVLENVPEYRKAPCFREWCCHMVGMGYRVSYEILSAADFGLPTERKRLFAVAHLHIPPIISATKTKTGWFASIAEMIAEMNDSELSEAQEKYLATKQVSSEYPFLIERIGYYNGKPKIALYDEPIWTIKKAIGSDGRGNNRRKFINVVMPNGSVKDLSVAALGVLQGFPANWEWGSVASSVGGIGNSVCPGIAKAIAEGIKQVMIDIL